jgi:hypothetical protein
MWVAHATHSIAYIEKYHARASEQRPKAAATTSELTNIPRYKKIIIFLTAQTIFTQFLRDAGKRLLRCFFWSN